MHVVHLPRLFRDVRYVRQGAVETSTLRREVFITLFVGPLAEKVHSAEVKRARERESAPDKTPEIALPTMTTHRGFPTRRTPARHVESGRRRFRGSGSTSALPARAEPCFGHLAWREQSCVPLCARMSPGGDGQQLSDHYRSRAEGFDLLSRRDDTVREFRRLMFVYEPSPGRMISRIPSVEIVVHMRQFFGAIGCERFGPLVG